MRDTMTYDDEREELTVRDICNALDARLDRVVCLLQTGHPRTAALELAAIKAEHADLAPLLSAYGDPIIGRLSTFPAVILEASVARGPHSTACPDASRRMTERPQRAHSAARRALSCTR